MKILRLFLIFTLFFSSLLFADDFPIKLSSIEITKSQLTKLRRKLPKTKKNLIFYHWTKPKTGIRWVLQGTLDQGEMDELNKFTGKRQNYGPGLYWALKNDSSTDFGTFPVAFRVKRWTPIYDTSVVEEVLGVRLNDADRIKLAKHLNYIDHLDDDWYLTNSVKNATDIVYGGLYDTRIRGSFSNDAVEMFSALWDGVRKNPDGLTMESHLHLLQYQDGLSYLRSMGVNPTNPWAEFEPENFEVFRQTRKRYFQKLVEGREAEERGVLGISTKETFGVKGVEEDKWVRKQIDDILPDIARGVSDGKISKFRNEGIRAGGSQKGQSFLATVEQVAELKSNPYLTVEYAADPKGRGYLVHYFYPDAFHYKKLKGRISDELFKILEKSDPSQLMADHSRRQMLNERLIGELLEDHFKRYHGKKVGYMIDGVGFMRDLMSIHPFSDFNGRSIRMYLRQASHEAGYIPPYFVLSDMDLLVSPTRMRAMLRISSKEHERLINEMLEELLMAKSEKRAVDFTRLDIKGRMLSALGPFGLEDDVELTQAHFDMIRHRRFTEFFDEVIGPQWRTSDSVASMKVFASIDDKAVKAAHLMNLKKADFFDNFSPSVVDDLLRPDFVGSEGRGFTAVSVLFQNVDERMKRKIAERVLTVSNGWGNPFFDNLAKEMIGSGFLTVDDIFNLLKMEGAPDSRVARGILQSIINEHIQDETWLRMIVKKIFSKKHWVDSDEGFQMLVDLYRKCAQEQKFVVSEVLPKLWDAGMRWSDRKFSDFAAEVAKTAYYRREMMEIFKKDESASVPEARKVLRNIVDSMNENTSVDSVKQWVDNVLKRDPWIKTDEGFQMVVDLYNKGTKEQKWEVSDALPRIWSERSGWSDKRFSDFALAVAQDGRYYREPMRRILQEEDAVTSKKAQKALRLIVDRFNEESDIEWYKKIVGDVLKKRHWLESDEGHQMVVGLYKRGTKHQKWEVSKVLPRMLDSRSWSDPKFSNFALAVAQDGRFYQSPMVEVLKREEAVKSKKAQKALRAIVDELNEESDIEWYKKVVGDVLKKRHWLESDEGHQMVVDLYQRGTKHQKWAVSEVLPRMLDSRSWSDPKFSNFAIAVARDGRYYQGPMVEVLKREEAVTFKKAQKALRAIVDELNEESDIDWYKKVISEVLNKRYWLESEEGFQMMVDLYKKGSDKQKGIVSDVLPKMWDAGYKWSDRKFASFVRYIAKDGEYFTAPMVELFKKDGSSDYVDAQRILRIIVDELPEGDKEEWYVKELFEEVFTQDQWADRDDIYKMMVDIYKKGSSYAREAMYNMSEAFQGKPCSTLMHGFL